jgi:TolB-like protein/Tfp pilus assembly protein PilF
MASIIPGFEYDIFISYRHNDNKHNNWVSEFVNNLKGELESTFKEDISIYFDENPHDPLLESHDVNKSLEAKLKSFIFIPILSQTYCDPKSYAWTNEFLIFNKMSNEDPVGKDIKLRNGNVASRILPVRIHDLDPVDIMLFEKEIGSVIRGIDFVFRTSSGVNRPLRSNEDHPNDNLNRTYYPDQINKVANAINELIRSHKSEQSVSPVSNRTNVQRVTDGRKAYGVKRSIRKTTGGLRSNRKAITAIAVLLFLAGAFSVFKIIEPTLRFHSLAKLDKSIAVLPFVNDSPDSENTYFINGIMEEVLNDLQKIKDFRVLSRTSTDHYKGQDRPTIPEIAKKLNVNYIVEGSGQKYGNTFRLRVQLIAVANERHLWADSYEQEIRDPKDIFRIQSQIAKAIAINLKTTITPEEKQLIEKPLTANLTAYDFYQRGREESTKYFLNNNNRESLKKAEDLYHKALKYDSTFARAYSGLAMIYWSKHYYEEYFSRNFLDSVPILADIALKYDSQLSEAFDIKGEYYTLKGLTNQAIEEYDKAISINPNDWMAYLGKGNLYADDDYIESIKNFLKAASLNHGPELPILLRSISMEYDATGFIDKAKYYNEETLKLDGDSVRYLTFLSEFERNMGNFEISLALSMKVNELDPNNMTNLFEGVARNLMYLGRHKESLKYYKIWFDKISSLGQFDLGSMHRIGYAYWVNGFRKESEYYFNKQIDYCNRIIKSGRPVITENYTYYDLAAVYAFRGNKTDAYKSLKLFNRGRVFPLWLVTLIKNDPLFDSIRKEQAFQEIVREVEAKYQTEHEKVRKWLSDQNQLQ